MKKTRRSFSSSEKAAIVKRHLVERVPVSDLCDEYQLQPTPKSSSSESAKTVSRYASGLPGSSNAAAASSKPLCQKTVPVVVWQPRITTPASNRLTASRTSRSALL